MRPMRENGSGNRPARNSSGSTSRRASLIMAAIRPMNTVQRYGRVTACSMMWGVERSSSTFVKGSRATSRKLLLSGKWKSQYR